MEVLKVQSDLLKSFINERLRDKEPWKVVLGTIGATIAANYVYNQLTHKVPFTVRLKKSVFRLVRKLPFVQKQLQAEMQSTRENFQKEFLSVGKDLEEFSTLPSKGMGKDEVLDQTKVILGLGHYDWKEGTQSGTVYNGNDALTELMTEVYGLAAWTNPLHPDAFPGVRKMEAEIVRMSCNIFNGGRNSCGSVTTGGTESIVLACKAYRDWARDKKGITDAVMVVPKTAHAAFDKAADMLDMTIRHVPVDPITQKVDLKAMKRAICSKTCMLVGSAPQFAHGSIDNIEEIAELGIAYGIPVHVDACLGGFLIGFMKEAGYPLKPFDFSLQGVTSISADTHKYGYAPKGSSVILYSDREYRNYQFFTVTDWPGGLYATTTIGGSRAGGIIAACWASLMYYGKDGYVDCTKKIIETTQKITSGIATIDGLKVIGDPQVSVVAFASDDFNIYSLSDLMKERGWNLSALQFPSSLHLCVTMVHTRSGVAERLIKDLKETTAIIKANPDAYKEGSAAVYGAAQSVPDRGIIDQVLWSYLDSLYATNDNNNLPS